jgi:hypothetical protein
MICRLAVMANMWRLKEMLSTYKSGKLLASIQKIEADKDTLFSLFEEVLNTEDLEFAIQAQVYCQSLLFMPLTTKRIRYLVYHISAKFKLQNVLAQHSSSRKHLQTKSVFVCSQPSLLPCDHFGEDH